MQARGRHADAVALGDRPDARDPREDLRRGRRVLEVRSADQRTGTAGAAHHDAEAAPGRQRLRHVNMLPPGRLRFGLFQALERQRLKREVAVSVTHLLAIPEMVAATDHCATLPRLICRRLAHDPRLKVLPTPVDLGSFPLHMAWHVRYRDDPAHAWLRALVGEVARGL